MAILKNDGKKMWPQLSVGLEQVVLRQPFWMKYAYMAVLFINGVKKLNPKLLEISVCQHSAGSKLFFRLQSFFFDTPPSSVYLFSYPAVRKLWLLYGGHPVSLNFEIFLPLVEIDQGTSYKCIKTSSPNIIVFAGR